MVVVAQILWGPCPLRNRKAALGLFLPTVPALAVFTFGFLRGPLLFLVSCLDPSLIKAN